MPNQATGDIRESILAEAGRQFAAHGFEGTSLRVVAEAVGIRKPSLLYHFPSKDELRRSVLDKMMSHWGEVLPRLLLAATSGEGRFEAVVQETVSFFSEDTDRARILAREVLDRPQEMEALIRARVSTWIDVIAGYIRKGQEQGSIYEEVDPEAYVIHMLTMIISISTTGHSLKCVLPANERRGVRHIKELLRIAKVSLFKPTDEQPKKKPKRSSKRRKR